MNRVMHHFLAMAAYKYTGIYVVLVEVEQEEGQPAK
jgi:hypothetical protein